MQIQSVVISRDMSGTAQVSAPVVSYRDKIGREVLSQTWGFGGAEIRAERYYEAATGLLSQQNMPHYLADILSPTTYEYDQYRRVRSAEG